MMPMPDADRFATNREDLCPALRWKGQFILAEPDPSRASLQRRPVLVPAHAKPASVRTANWPSRAIARRRRGRVTGRESAGEE